MASANDGLTEFYREHSQWLRATLRKRFGIEDTEDYLQETYLQALRWSSTKPTWPRAWLLQIALNVVRQGHRRKLMHSPDAFPEFEGRHSVERGDADQAEALLLKQIIQRLPPKLRVVFVLSRFEGSTYAEIAQRCNISVKTVEWRMTKALAICANHLRD